MPWSDPWEEEIRMSVSIYDVAAEAGVSIATVSRILNKSAAVSPKKVAAVQAAMEKLHFEPNQFARGLVNKQANMIGVYMLDGDVSVFDSTYSIELLKGIQRVLTYQDKCMTLIVERPGFHKRAGGIPAYREYVRSKRIDGLILNGPLRAMMPPEVEKELREMDFPVVYIGRQEESEFLNVYAHYVEYCLEILEHLRAKGHTNILYYAISMHENYIRQVKSITDTWQDGTKIRFRLLHTGEMTRDQYKKELQKYVCGGEVTAVCMPDYDQAVTMLGVCNELNIPVPDRLSLVAVTHRMNEAKQTYPPLSTLYVPAVDMGASAAELLLRRLNGDDIPETGIEYKPRYTERESVKDMTAPATP